MTPSYDNVKAALSARRVDLALRLLRAGGAPRRTSAAGSAGSGDHRLSDRIVAAQQWGACEYSYASFYHSRAHSHAHSLACPLARSHACRYARTFGPTPCPCVSEL